MALRPSHCESIRTSVWAVKSASTQPVSRLVALPLPQLSSVPLNVVLFAASWQLRLVTVGSLMLNVVPECVVLSVTGFGPFHAAVPLPRMTCSWVPRTAPVRASTSTVSRLYPSAPVPLTVDCHASRGVSPRAYTTSCVPSILLTLLSCLVATASAAALVREGVRDSAPIGLVIATDEATFCPALLVTMTKSPPTTGSEPYLRWKGT